jgi:TPP-dependent pyruvate/acetoin dehydrogenase alpha subunit
MEVLFMHKIPILPYFQGISQVPDRTPGQHVDLLERMIVIREFEEKVQRLYMQGLIHGTTHLCQGQEAVSVGVMSEAKPEDYVTVTYRSHGHAIAKGMDTKTIFSELMGRSNGCSKGKGGSMHLTDFQINLIGSFGIIGAGMPVGLGAALSAKIRKDPRVSITFFGDGTSNIGAFHETLNMAAIMKAPLIMICENNIYGEFSRIDETTSVETIAERAAAYGIPSKRIDGNNVLMVAQEMKQAREDVMIGRGPIFLECVTYRHRGHSRTDPAKYRPEEEVKAWLAYDPIPLYANWLIEHGLITAEKWENITQRIRHQIDEAAAFAEQSPWPNVDEISDHVYAGEDQR